jgi:hypothetical protein
LDDGTNVDGDDLKRKEEELTKMLQKVKVSNVQSLKALNLLTRFESCDLGAYAQHIL